MSLYSSAWVPKVSVSPLCRRTSVCAAIARWFTNVWFVLPASHRKGSASVSSDVCLDALISLESVLCSDSFVRLESVVC